MSTAIRELPGCIHQERRIPPPASLSRQRAEALERLVILLEGNSAPARRRRIPTGESETNQMQRMARLRAAHASYALASGFMQRVEQGAWVRSR